MFLARIDGNITPAATHATLKGCRFLIGQRIEADGTASGEPLWLVDWLGAGIGSTVIASTDGDITRERLGNTTPARLVVVGIVDSPGNAGGKS
jgi:ethanolamine utilization protein EutN